MSDTDNSGAFATLTGAAPTTSRAFTAVGDHPVAVRVTDAGGHALVARDLVTVADPLVAALALSPDNPETGDALTLDASGSSGGAGARSFRFDRDGDGVPDGDAASTDARTTVPIGAGCKVCDRPACPQRAFPQLGRPIHVDAAIADSIPYHPDPA